jgi:dTDP-4-dehydrorhamnose reductase
MNIMVLGAYGMLGHRLMLELGGDHDVIGTARSPKVWDAPVMRRLGEMDLRFGIDANDFEGVERLIRSERPDTIVNCIGIVKQVKEAKDPITSITVNSMFPHKLARLCGGMGVGLVHLSTDCVFSGKKGNYSIKDDPDPLDLYGRSKLLGEVAGDGILTIRTSLIGREIASKNGLVEWLLSNKGKKVRGFKKAIFTGYPTGEMSRIIRSVIDREDSPDGIWQVASEPISKFELISKIAAEAHLGIEIAPENRFSCDRSLDGRPFNEAVGYKPPKWDKLISDMVSEFNDYEEKGDEK